MAMASAEPALSEGLLEYYKLRVATSEAEIAELRARVDAWAPSHALLHTSKWALQKRDDEVRPTHAHAARAAAGMVGPFVPLEASTSSRHGVTRPGLPPPFHLSCVDRRSPICRARWIPRTRY